VSHKSVPDQGRAVSIQNMVDPERGTHPCQIWIEYYTSAEFHLMLLVLLTLSISFQKSAKGYVKLCHKIAVRLPKIIYTVAQAKTVVSWEISLWHLAVIADVYCVPHGTIFWLCHCRGVLLPLSFAITLTREPIFVTFGRHTLNLRTSYKVSVGLPLSIVESCVEAI